MKVNVLGTEYTIKSGVKAEDDAHFSSSEADGYIDYQTKEIIIKEMPEESHELTNDIASYERLVIRHELAHAFLYESGLTDYAVDERLVEWMAIQLPKMAKIIKKIDVDS